MNFEESETITHEIAPGITLTAEYLIRGWHRDATMIAPPEGEETVYLVSASMTVFGREIDLLDWVDPARKSEPLEYDYVDEAGPEGLGDTLWDLYHGEIMTEAYRVGHEVQGQARGAA